MWLLLKVLNPAPETDEIFKEAFDPGEAITETVRLASLRIRHQLNDLVTEPLLFLELF